MVIDVEGPQGVEDGWPVRKLHFPYNRPSNAVSMKRVGLSKDRVNVKVSRSTDYVPAYADGRLCARALA